MTDGFEVFHLQLTDGEDLLKQLPGTRADMLASGAASISLTGQFSESTGPVLLWATGLAYPVILKYEHSENTELPVTIHLNVSSAAETPNNPTPVQFLLEEFEIRKVEVWAEKTSDPERQIAVVAENTLLLESTSGAMLLISPWLPGPVISISQNADEINETLQSGRFLLKHIYT